MATEPVVGWRVWNLVRDRLQAWAVDYDWTPGENVATCHAPSRARCPESPGTECQCGFWAVWTPEATFPRAVAAVEPPWHVLGLVTGWGTVALHGREGWRAERATIRCLFVDRPWANETPFMRRSAFHRFLGTLRSPIGQGGEMNEVVPLPVVERPDRAGLDHVAAYYSVPLTSVAGAARLGLLSEFGVPARQVAAIVDDPVRWPT